MLCEHTYRRLHPWGLPGGDLNYREDPVEGVKREVVEETGMTIQETRLLLVENSNETHHISITYLCSGLKGRFIPNEEVSNILFFETTALPGFFAEHRVTIEKCLAILNSEK